jgi:hypothetical protein
LFPVLEVLKQPESVGRRPVAWVTAAIWAGILLAGLWPFNFLARNHAVWLQDGPGLHFDRYGEALSSSNFEFSAPNASLEAATVELAFRPAVPYHGASSVFSLVTDETTNFAIGQSSTDLYVRGKFQAPAGKTVSKFYVDEVCRDRRMLYITVALGEGQSRVYVDGRLARALPYSVMTRDFSGTFVVGHDPHSVEPWTGDVVWLTILNRMVSPAEVADRFQSWQRNQLATGRFVSAREVVYHFDGRSGASVPNAGNFGPDLVLPAIFRVRQPTVLEWPDHWDGGVVVDAMVNIAGFVPFGVFTVLYLRLNRGWGMWPSVGTTIFFGTLLSLVIELLQVLLPSRDSSLADLVTNALGTIAGSLAAFFYFIFVSRYTQPPSIRRSRLEFTG